MRCGKHVWKSIRQSTQKARRKSSIAGATLDDGPFRRPSQLLVEPRKIPRQSGSKERAALRTRAIVAFPAPAREIRSLVVTAGGIVKRRLHPIVKRDRTFTFDSLF